MCLCAWYKCQRGDILFRENTVRGVYVNYVRMLNASVTSMTVDLEDMERQCQMFDFVTGCVLVGILCLLGISGNLTSFVVLWKHKSETATMFLLEVLAISDSILLICCLAIYVLPELYPYLGEMDSFYQHYSVVQTFIWPLSLMAHTTTVWVTVLVTLNR